MYDDMRILPNCTIFSLSCTIFGLNIIFFSTHDRFCFHKHGWWHWCIMMTFMMVTMTIDLEACKKVLGQTHWGLLCVSAPAILCNRAEMAPLPISMIFDPILAQLKINGCQKKLIEISKSAPPILCNCAKMAPLPIWLILDPILAQLKANVRSEENAVDMWMANCNWHVNFINILPAWPIT